MTKMKISINNAGPRVKIETRDKVRIRVRIGMRVRVRVG
jgi:hypothetical protein